MQLLVTLHKILASQSILQRARAGHLRNLIIWLGYTLQLLFKPQTFSTEFGLFRQFINEVSKYWSLSLINPPDCLDQSLKFSAACMNTGRLHVGASPVCNWLLVALLWLAVSSLGCCIKKFRSRGTVSWFFLNDVPASLCSTIWRLSSSMIRFLLATMELIKGPFPRLFGIWRVTAIALSVSRDVPPAWVLFYFII